MKIKIKPGMNATYIKAMLTSMGYRPSRAQEITEEVVDIRLGRKIKTTSPLTGVFLKGGIITA